MEAEKSLLAPWDGKNQTLDERGVSSYDSDDIMLNAKETIFGAEGLDFTLSERHSNLTACKNLSMKI